MEVAAFCLGVVATSFTVINAGVLTAMVSTGILRGPKGEPGFQGPAGIAGPRGVPGRGYADED